MGEVDKAARTPLLLAVRIGFRYAWSRRRELSRVTNWVSLIGISFGISLLIVVLSVYNGFTESGNDDFFRYVPHALISKKDIDSADIAAIQLRSGVESIEQFVVFQALVQIEHDREIRPMTVYGVEQEKLQQLPLERLPKRRDIKNIPAVAMSTSAPGARFHNSFVVSMTVPIVNSQSLSTQTGAFEVLHYFTVPLYMPNTLLVVTIEDLLMSGLISREQVQLRVTVEDPFLVDRVLMGIPNVRTWTTQFGSLFQAFAMEKTILFVMLMLIVALAALNVVAGQAMLINRKSGDIAIFRTMGAEQRWITATFLLHGATIVFLGVVLGTLFGLLLSHFAAGIVAFVVETLFADSVPMLLSLLRYSVVYVSDVVWTISLATIIGVLAIFWPLSMVYKKDPVEALGRTI